jgi:hypothetical protein
MSVRLFGFGFGKAMKLVYQGALGTNRAYTTVFFQRCRDFRLFDAH